MGDSQRSKQMLSLVEFVRSTPFFTIAHRGASGEAPENTLSAIQLAIQQGSAMIEIDVQTTCDDQLVAFHDDEVHRTTNGTGTVRSLSYTELEQLDAGSWFHERYKNEKIPLLGKVLDVINGKAYVNVEIKPRDHNPLAEEMVGSLVRELDNRGMLPFALFSSFDHELLLLIRKLRSDIHTCALNVPGDNRPPSEILFSAHANAFGCSVQELNAERAADCRNHGIPWGVYTVNEPEALEYARSFGVHAVVTNVPSSLQPHVNSTR